VVLLVGYDLVVGWPGTADWHVNSNMESSLRQWKVVNLFSPLLPMKTGVALSVEALIDGLDHLLQDSGVLLVLWVEKNNITLNLRSRYQVKRFSAVSLDQAQMAELLCPDAINVFQIGNSPTFHAEIASVMSVVPGIVIIHDGVLLDLYWRFASVMRDSLLPYPDRATISEVRYELLKRPSLIYLFSRPLLVEV
jgi:hypothetical protein